MSFGENEHLPGGTTKFFEVGKAVTVSRIEELGEQFTNDLEAFFKGAGFSEEEAYKFGFAVREMALNGIVHGNLKMPSRTGYEGNYDDDMLARESDPRYAGKHVTIEFSVANEKMLVNITDEGDGFDVAHLHDSLSSDELLNAGGRGELISGGFCDEIVYSAKGNSVTLKKRIPKL